VKVIHGEVSVRPFEVSSAVTDHQYLPPHRNLPVGTSHVPRDVHPLPSHQSQLPDGPEPEHTWNAYNTCRLVAELAQVPNVGVRVPTSASSPGQKERNVGGSGSGAT
jgi:hypothetical protein